MTWQYLAHDEADTERLGQALARVLSDGTTVGLIGTLGAGKTRLVQALASALGVDRQTVVSPTYVLCHEYPGEKPIVHMDAYRLADEDEFMQLGPEEYFDGPGIVVIEWSDRVADCLPEERIDISITVDPNDRRRFAIHSYGERYAEVPDSLRRILESEPPIESASDAAGRAKPTEGSEMG